MQIKINKVFQWQYSYVLTFAHQGFVLLFFHTICESSSSQNHDAWRLCVIHIYTCTLDPPPPPPPHAFECFYCMGIRVYRSFLMYSQATLASLSYCVYKLPCYNHANQGNCAKNQYIHVTRGTHLQGGTPWWGRDSADPGRSSTFWPPTGGQPPPECPSPPAHGQSAKKPPESGN